MIGHVDNRHAVLPITFRLPNGELSIDYVIDTGFTGFLTLPVTAVTALNLPHLEDISANLANDTTVALPVHVATIMWNGTPLDVRVLATGRRPLLGTALLDGHELSIQFAESGLVRVDPL